MCVGEDGAEHTGGLVPHLGGGNGGNAGGTNQEQVRPAAGRTGGRFPGPDAVPALHRGQRPPHHRRGPGLE